MDGREKKRRSDSCGQGGEGTDGVKGGHRLAANEKKKERAEEIAAAAEQRKQSGFDLTPRLSLRFRLCCD